MERIHTRVVIKIDTGEVLEDRFYSYNGPMAMCGDPGDASDYGGAFESGAFQSADWSNTFGGSQVQDFGFGLTGYFDENEQWHGVDLSGDIGDPDPMGFGSVAPGGTSIGSISENTFGGGDIGDPDPMGFGSVSSGTQVGSLTGNTTSAGGFFTSTLRGLGLGAVLGVPGMMLGAIGGAVYNGVKTGAWNPTDVQNYMSTQGISISPEQAAGITSATQGYAGDADGFTGGAGAGATNTTGGGGGMSPISGGSYQDILAQIAQDMYNKTNPARTEIINRGTNFLEGGLDVTQSPMWGSGKNAAETQYQLARDATMANLPGGGALQSSLATGETDKARTLTDLASRIGMDEYNKIYGLASGAPQQSMSALGTAGQTSATLAGQEMYQNIQEDAQKNQLYSDLGAGIGEGWGDKE